MNESIGQLPVVIKCLRERYRRRALLNDACRKVSTDAPLDWFAAVSDAADWVTSYATSNKEKDTKMVTKVTATFTRFVAMKRLLDVAKFRGKIWFEHRRVKDMYLRSTDVTTANSDARALVGEMLVARGRAMAMRERDKELRAAIEAAGNKIDATVLTLLLKPQTAHQLFNKRNRTYTYQRRKSLGNLPPIPFEWFEPSVDNNATFTHSVDYVLRGLAMYVAFANSVQLTQQFAEAALYSSRASEVLNNALAALYATDPGSDGDVLPYETSVCEAAVERIWQQPPLLEQYVCSSCQLAKNPDQFSAKPLAQLRRHRWRQHSSTSQLCLICEQAYERY